MNWKNMPLSHKIATVIAGLAVIAWLIPKVQPTLLPFDPSYPAIAVFTVDLLLMIVVYSIRCNVDSVIGNDAWHRLERIVHEVLCCSRCLLLVESHSLCSHHRILHAYGIDALLHLHAPRDTAWAIVEKIILSLR